ncbi:MAG: VTT domain-containing protein [Chloroflexota bacterium]|nr:VTT domain-containing protein [Chloroflexota bacterium]
MNKRVQPAAVSGSLTGDNPQEAFSSRSLLIGGALFLALLTALYILVQSIGIDELQAIIATSGIWGPLIFVGIKALTFTFAPLSAGPIQFASGILFGVIPGTLYSLLGELLGGTVNVIIARLFGRRIVRRFVGAAAMSRVDGFYERHLNDWKSLLAARVLLFSVYDFISYAVGFSQIRLSVYIAVSFLGGLIPTLLFVLIGSEASQNQNVLLMFYLLAAIAFFVLVLFRAPISRMMKQYGRQVQE